MRCALLALCRASAAFARLAGQPPHFECVEPLGGAAAQRTVIGLEIAGVWWSAVLASDWPGGVAALLLRLHRRGWRHALALLLALWWRALLMAVCVVALSFTVNVGVNAVFWLLDALLPGDEFI